MFEIQAGDLAARRDRCKPVIDRLTAEIVFGQTCCNICGAASGAVLADKDRYGFQIRSVMCLRCGLVYLADRFTDTGYSEFYKRGAYRELTGGFIGAHQSIESVKQDQYAYAASVIEALPSCFARRNTGSLLDVGGSAGLIARQVAARFGLEGTVLDPSEEEIAAARAAGQRGIVGTIESFETAEKFDLILLCRSIEHLFDLRCSLLKMRDLLSDGGLLYCDIIDFPECCRLRGPPQAITKIDHCFWLAQETAPAIFRSVGLEIVSMNLSSDPECIGYFLQRRELAAPAESDEVVLHGLLRQLREIDSDWRFQARTAQNATDRFRRSAYRVKRNIYRSIRGMLPESSR